MGQGFQGQEKGLRGSSWRRLLAPVSAELAPAKEARPAWWTWLPSPRIPLLCNGAAWALFQVNVAVCVFVTLYAEWEENQQGRRDREAGGITVQGFRSKFCLCCSVTEAA